MKAIASVLKDGKTKPAPLRSVGQMTPKIKADAVR
jgi:hypothetical protein